MLKISILFVVCMAAITAAQKYFSIAEGTTGILYGGFITVYGSVLAIIIGRQNETEASYERHLREKKLAIYHDLIDHLLDFDVGQESSDSGQVKNIRAMTRSLIIWGSDDALKKWINYIVSLRGKPNYGADEENSLRNARPGLLENYLDPKAEAILVIRKELGHSNKRLSNDDILTIFVPFIRELRKISKQKGT